MALIQCPLRARALNNPESIAVVLDGQPVSAIMLDAWVGHYQNVLEKQMSAGEHLLCLPCNTLATVIVILACFRARIVYCPVNPAFPVVQIQGYARRINARFMVADEQVSLPECQSLPEPQRTVTRGNGQQPLTLDLNALCDLIPTSGTTDIPKAVAHTLANHWYSAEGSLAMLPLTGGDSWLLSLPLFHVGGFGIVVRCIQSGAAMVIDSQRTPLATLLRKVPVSHISLVNTQLFRLLESEDFSFTNTVLKSILLGGGAASPALVKKVQDAGVRILTTYGMTEMSSQVCTSEPVFTADGVTSGKVLPYRKVQIAEDGEILVAGQTLSPGYFCDGQVQPLVDARGWYHTGDRGVWVDQALQVLGRMDNMFISGGENIHPEEIEQALLGCEGIDLAVVVAIDDGEFGQRPIAFVETNKYFVDEWFTRGLLEGKISRFKIPDRIFLMPKTLPERFSAQSLYSGIKPNRNLLQKLALVYCAPNRAD